MSTPSPKPAPRNGATLPADTPADETPAEVPVAVDGVLRSDVVAELTKLASVRVERDQLTAEEKEHLSNVRDAVRGLPKGEYTDEAGRLVLTLSWPASFDSGVAARVLPASLLPAVSRRVPVAGALEALLAEGVIDDKLYNELTTTAVDAALAKENLPPKVYATCLSPAPNPTIKPHDPARVGGKGKGGR